MRYAFYQFFFFRQWNKLRAYANERSIQIIGDIPIFVAYDSSDVWSHPGLFYLDKEGNPTVVAGVPPDAFPQRVSYGVIRFITGKCIRKMVMPGGFHECMHLCRSLIFYVLTISAALPATMRSPPTIKLPSLDVGYLARQGFIPCSG